MQCPFARDKRPLILSGSSARYLLDLTLYVHSSDKILPCWNSPSSFAPSPKAKFNICVKRVRRKVLPNKTRAWKRMKPFDRTADRLHICYLHISPADSHLGLDFSDNANEADLNEPHLSGFWHRRYSAQTEAVVLNASNASKDGQSPQLTCLTCC